MWVLVFLFVFFGYLAHEGTYKYAISEKTM